MFVNFYVDVEFIRVGRGRERWTLGTCLPVWPDPFPRPNSINHSHILIIREISPFVAVNRGENCVRKMYIFRTSKNQQFISILLDETDNKIAELALVVCMEAHNSTINNWKIARNLIRRAQHRTRVEIEFIQFTNEQKQNVHFFDERNKKKNETYLYRYKLRVQLRTHGEASISFQFKFDDPKVDLPLIN